MLIVAPITFNLLILQNIYSYETDFILSMYLIPMIGLAQSVWEAPNAEDHKVTTSTFIDNKENSEAKYLKGAVPEVDGKVEWRLDIDVPKKMLRIYTI